MASTVTVKNVRPNAARTLVLQSTKTKLGAYGVTALSPEQLEDGHVLVAVVADSRGVVKVRGRGIKRTVKNHLPVTPAGECVKLSLSDFVLRTPAGPIVFVKDVAWAQV